MHLRRVLLVRGNQTRCVGWATSLCVCRLCASQDLVREAASWFSGVRASSLHMAAPVAGLRRRACGAPARKREHEAAAQRPPRRPMHRQGRHLYRCRANASHGVASIDAGAHTMRLAHGASRSARAHRPPARADGAKCACKRAPLPARAPSTSRWPCAPACPAVRACTRTARGPRARTHCPPATRAACATCARHPCARRPRALLPLCYLCASWRIAQRPTHALSHATDLRSVSRTATGGGRGGDADASATGRRALSRKRR